MIEVLHPLGAPEAPETDDDGPQPAWIPDSVQAADWVARKARRARQEIDEVEANYQAQLAYLNAYRADGKRPHERTLVWAEQVLELWLRGEIDRDDSKKPRKSRVLPSGVKVGLTGGQPRLEVENEPAFVDWLKTYRPELVTAEIQWKWDKRDVTSKVRDDKDRLVAADPETGEVVEAPGARIVRRQNVNVDTGGDS